MVVVAGGEDRAIVLSRERESSMLAEEIKTALAKKAKETLLWIEPTAPGSVEESFRHEQMSSGDFKAERRRRELLASSRGATRRASRVAQKGWTEASSRKKMGELHPRERSHRKSIESPSAPLTKLVGHSSIKEGVC